MRSVKLVVDDMFPHSLSNANVKKIPFFFQRRLQCQGPSILPHVRKVFKIVLLDAPLPRISEDGDVRRHKHRYILL